MNEAEIIEDFKVLVNKLLKKIENLESRVFELEKENAELKKENAELRKENAELKAEIKRLKGTDSGNSSKPPSTDKKGNKKKDRNISVKDFKAPKQKNKAGKTRTRYENPDKVIKCEASTCSFCGESLENIEGEVQTTRQEVDIPPIKPIVTEYQQIKKVCNCGCKNIGSYPEEIKSHIQFGDNLKATALYLNVSHYIPFQRTTKILSELLGMGVSEGSLENILEKAKEKSHPHYSWIKERLKKSDWVGSDETGFRFGGENGYRWVWQNNSFSYFASHKSRGYQVVKDYFGEDYEGILVHDCYSAQNKTPAKLHQLCLPHIFRKLNSLIEFQRSKWAFKIKKCFKKALDKKKEIFEDGFDSDKRLQIQQQIEKDLDQLLFLKFEDENEESLRWSLFRHRNKLLTFLHFKNVPADNNGSERAIRGTKIHHKISNGFRNIDSAQRHSIILSVVETAKKHGLNILQSFKNLLNNSLVFT